MKGKGQYLFNLKLFYNKENNQNFPSILCLPTFIFYTFSVILSDFLKIMHPKYKNINDNYNLKKANDILRSSFFHTLPTVVHLIASDDETEKYSICSPIEFHTIFLKEIQNIIDNEKYSIPSEIFALETYMKNEESRQLYLQKLHLNNLKINGVETLADLISKLDADEIAHPHLEIIEKSNSFPGSLHYTIYNTDTYPIPQFYGPKGWGPFYWKIFHSLAEKGELNDIYKMDENIKYTLHCYISLLPYIIPCAICSQHYYLNIKPSKILDNLFDNENVKPTMFYSKIHENVTENINRLK